MARSFVGLMVTIALGILWMAPAAQAQPSTKVARIGLLHPLRPTPLHETFWHRLHDLGYVEGHNLVVERRYAEGQRERLPALAAELVRLQVDVLFAPTPAAVRAAKEATGTIPIVALDLETDPVGSGLVASLARPGGNLTGVFLDLAELRGKQLELLKAAVPGLMRVAVLWDATTSPDPVRAAEGAARSLGIQLHTLGVQHPDDFDRVMAAVTTGGAEALLLLSAPLLYPHRARIVEYAAKRRLPMMSGAGEDAALGGLMAYRPNAHEMFRRAAVYVAQILQGAKPADLPVERPMKYELVINLKTAQALGITMPRSLLLLADEVIQ